MSNNPKNSIVIDLTGDIEIIELTGGQTITNNFKKDVAILRTLHDNGLIGPVETPVSLPVSIISSPPHSRTTAHKPRSQSQSQPQLLDDVNVLKVVKATKTLSSPRKPKLTPTEIFTVPSDPPPVSFSDKKCPVCFDTLSNPSVTLCGHVFCTECLQTVVKSSKLYPICRRKLTVKGFHPVYF